MDSDSQERTAWPAVSALSGIQKRRGKPQWRDGVHWAGGYPFAVAKPEEILRFYRDRGFRLLEMKTNGGSMACNEFMFCKLAAADTNQER